MLLSLRKRYETTPLFSDFAAAADTLPGAPAARTAGGGSPTIKYDALFVAKLSIVPRFGLTFLWQISARVHAPSAVHPAAPKNGISLHPDNF